MRLWLVRHARVQLAGGLCYGASDVPADPDHTQAVAATLATVLPAGAPLWVSGLGRAQQLAAAVRAQRGDLALPTVDLRLNEMNFGQWELQAWDAIPSSAFDGWMADFAHHRFGGAESTQQVIARVAAALADTTVATHETGAADAVWICHAGVIRAVRYVVAHGAQPIQGVHQWPEHAPEPGGYIQITL
jgi:alpha-ribazole phosphatase